MTLAVCFGEVGCEGPGFDTSVSFLWGRVLGTLGASE